MIRSKEAHDDKDSLQTVIDGKRPLEHQEIQAITKYLVEDALKREVSTPRHRKYNTQIFLEDALKQEINNE